MFLSQGSNCFEKCFLEAMHAEFHMSVWLMELQLHHLPLALRQSQNAESCHSEISNFREMFFLFASVALLAILSH